jgi:nucleoside 2-deoxyribosyltransferase
MNIYLAGGVFNAAERLHNLYLARALERLGHTVILPQREALQFFSDGSFNVAAIREDCRQSASTRNNIFVGSADGADADAGTSIEYGLAIQATGRAVIYRTDFRTDEAREIGMNAMLKLNGTAFVYDPCFITDLDEAEAFYASLAQKIHEAIYPRP